MASERLQSHNQLSLLNMGGACIFTAGCTCRNQPYDGGALKLKTRPSKPSRANKGELVTFTRPRTQKYSLPQERPPLPSSPLGLLNKPFTVCSSAPPLDKQLQPCCFFCHSEIRQTKYNSLEKGKNRNHTKSLTITTAIVWAHTRDTMSLSV